MLVSIYFVKDCRLSDFDGSECSSEYFLTHIIPRGELPIFSDGGGGVRHSFCLENQKIY